MAYTPTPEEEAYGEDYSRDLMSASAKLANQMQRQANVLASVEKSLSSYHKGLTGALAGIMRAAVTKAKLDSAEQKELALLKRKMDMQWQEVKRLQARAAASATEENKHKVLVAQERYLALKNQAVMMEKVKGLQGTTQALKVVQTALTGLVKSIRETQTQFGVSSGQALRVEFSNLTASIRSFGRSISSLGKTAAASPEQIKRAQADFQDEFGGVLTSDAATRLAEEATRLGITTAQMAKARRAFMTTTLGDVSRAKAETDRFVNAFARQGLTSKDAMKAIEQNSDLLARNGMRFADAFARALASSKKIGVELSKVDQFADSIIDNFEGFLEAQAELGAMGVGFDTSRLGELAVSGDTAAFQDELRRQLRELGPQLLELNRPQQLALQQMSGMTMAELQKLAGITEGSGEATLSIDQQNNSLLSRMVELLNSLVNPGLAVLATALAIHTSLLTVIATSTAATAGSSVLGTIASILGAVASALLPIAAAIAVILGVGGLAYLATKKFTGSRTGDDVVSKPGYGKRRLVTEKGTIALNNQDNVIAYADDMAFGGDSGTKLLSKGAIASRTPHILPEINVNAGSFFDAARVQTSGPGTLFYDAAKHFGVTGASKYGKAGVDIGMMFANATFPTAAALEGTAKAFGKAGFSGNLANPNEWGRGGWNLRRVPGTRPWWYEGASENPTYIQRQLHKNLGYRRLPDGRFGIPGGTVMSDDDLLRAHSAEQGSLLGRRTHLNVLRAGAGLDLLPDDASLEGPGLTRMEALMAPGNAAGQNVGLMRQVPGAIGKTVTQSLFPSFSHLPDAEELETLNRWQRGAKIGGTVAGNALKGVSTVLRWAQLLRGLEQFPEDKSYLTEWAVSLLAGKAAASLTAAGAGAAATAEAASGIGLAGVPMTAGAGLVGSISADVATGLLVSDYFNSYRNRRDTGDDSPIFNAFRDVRDDAFALPGKIWDGALGTFKSAASSMGNSGKPFYESQAFNHVYHNGGIVGSKNEVPAVLQKGEAVFTAPQYQRIQELANIATMAGVDATTVAPAVTSNSNIDLTPLTQTIGQLLNAFSGMQVNLDGNRVSKILNTTSQGAIRFGILEKQNIDVTNAV